jgi:hypothetical protein
MALYARDRGFARKAEQACLRQTDNFREGLNAMSERRVPNFAGR